MNLLLQALENAKKQVDYYALDLSRTELERTLAQLPTYKYIGCHGLLGTYDDGREWLKKPSNVARQKCILSLGSSIGEPALFLEFPSFPFPVSSLINFVGNFLRVEAPDFLRDFAEVLGDGDTMLIGLDGCSDPAKV